MRNQYWTIDMDIALARRRATQTKKREMDIQKKSENQRRKETQRDFLNTFFQDSGIGYAETEVNDHYLVRSWNKDAGYWQIAIYKPDAFNRYKMYQETRKKEVNHE